MDARKTLERQLIAALTPAACPSPEQLADHITGAGPADPTQQLVLAAHVRRCPLCQAEIALYRPPDPRPRLVLARLVPLLYQGTRGGATPAELLQYRAEQLTIDLTVVSQPNGGWRISGMLRQAEQALPDHEVQLRRARGRRFSQRTDGRGSFSFLELDEGRYTLSVRDARTTVQVRGLVLG